MSLFRFTVAHNSREKDEFLRLKNTPDDFIAQMLKRGHGLGSKDGSAIIGAWFKDGGRLEQKYVETATALILDVDGKFRRNGEVVHEVIDPEWFLSLVPFRGIAHSSYTHSPAHPKFRVILPLAEEVSLQDFHRLWWWMYEKTQRKGDPSTKNPDRLFYLPRCTKEAKDAGWAWMRELFGPVLSIKMVPADYQPKEQANYDRPRKQQGMHTAPAEARFGHVDTQALLDKMKELPLFKWAFENPGSLSREVWRGIATNIGAAVLEDDEQAQLEGSKLFHWVSEPDEERYNQSVTERTYKDAIKSARDYGPMTYATLITNGAPEDCAEGTTYKSPVAHARHLLHEEEKLKSPKEVAPAEKKQTAPAGAVETQSQPAGEPKKAEFQFVDPEDLPPGVGDDGGVSEGDTIWNHDPKDFLFDVPNSRWMTKNRVSGEWTEDITDQAFSQMLMNLGLPRKKQDGFKSQISHFLTRKAVYETDEHYVVRDEMPIFNTYRRGKILPVPGDFSDIKALVLNLSGNDPDGYEYILDWLALPTQKLLEPMFRPAPGKKAEPYKMGTSCVFLGAQGSGKGTLSLIMQLIYGDTNVVTIGQDILDGRFNGILIDKLFVVANEVMSASNRSAETANKIKPWITDPVIPIEQKHREPMMVTNNFNIIFTSNDDRPVILEKTDRRYSVFRSGPLDPAVSARLYKDLMGDKKQVAAFLDHLLTRQVSLVFGQLYQSAAREEMIRSSGHSDEKFVAEILSDGWMSVAQPWVDASPPNKIREATVQMDLVASATMLEVYNDWCRRNSVKSRGAIKLGATVQMEIAGVTAQRIYIGGVQTRVWKGIPMHSPDHNVLPLPQPEAPQAAIVGGVAGDNATFDTGPKTV